jgi:hypothetical protein
MQLGLILFVLTVIALIVTRVFINNRKAAFDRLYKVLSENPGASINIFPTLDALPANKATPSQIPSKSEMERRVTLTRLRVSIGISFTVLLSALYIIIFTETVESQKWAFGAVGIIMGYWLKP